MLLLQITDGEGTPAKQQATQMLAHMVGCGLWVWLITDICVWESVGGFAASVVCAWQFKHAYI